MSVLRIDVKIYEDGKFIKLLRKQKVKSGPDKTSGIQYSGQVYNLYYLRADYPSIDIEEDGSSADDCGDWEKSKPLRYQDVLDEGTENWDIFTVKEVRFLAFDGSASWMAQLLDSLEGARILSLYPEDFIAPSKDVTAFDWFVRLNDTRTPAEQRVIIERAMMVGNQGAPFSAKKLKALAELLPQQLRSELTEAGYGEASASELVRWLGRVILTEREATEDSEEKLIAENERLNEAVKALETSLASSRQELVKIQQDLEMRLAVASEEKERLKNQLDKKSDNVLQSYGLERKFDEIIGRICDLEDSYSQDRQATVRNTELSTRLRKIEDENKSLRDRILNGAGMDGKPSLDWRATSAVITEALKQFENLVFHVDTPEIILTRFPDPTNLFMCFRQLNERKSLRSRAIANAKSWREFARHINTGSSSGSANMGRIYFTRVEDGKHFIVVHHKKDGQEQSRLISRLEDPVFMRRLEV